VELRIISASNIEVLINLVKTTETKLQNNWDNTATQKQVGDRNRGDNLAR
jgi:hypothetical protein